MKGAIDYAPEERDWHPGLCHPGLGAEGGKEDDLLSDLDRLPAVTSHWSVHLYLTATQRRGGKLTCFTRVVLAPSIGYLGR